MWGALITTALQMGLGMAQQARANKEKQEAQNRRPSYDAPEGAKRALKMQEQAQASGMPGYNRALQQLQSNKANTFRRVLEGARGSADIANVASSLQASSDDAIQNLNVQDAAFREQARQNVVGQLGNMADYQDKAWQWNYQDPYLRDYSESNQRHFAGMQTMNNAIDAMGGVMTLMGEGGSPMMQQGVPQVGMPQVNTPNNGATQMMPAMNAGGEAVQQMALPPSVNPWADALAPKQGNQFNVASSINPYTLPNDPNGVMSLANQRGPGFNYGINPYSSAGRMLNINPF